MFSSPELIRINFPQKLLSHELIRINLPKKLLNRELIRLNFPKARFDSDQEKIESNTSLMRIRIRRKLDYKLL